MKGQIMTSKEDIFKEFDIERKKDLKLSKKTKDNKEVFKNRIAYLQSHAEAKSLNSSVYRHLKINFKNLIKMYESGDPDQYNWDTLGIVPWHIQQQREAQRQKDEKKSNTIH